MTEMFWTKFQNKKKTVSGPKVPGQNVSCQNGANLATKVKMSPVKMSPVIMALILAN